VRVRWSVRSAGLLFGILALALGGCGTSGVGSRMHASLLENQPAAPATSSLTSRPGPESASRNGEVIRSAAVSAESRTDAGTSNSDAAPKAFVPVAFEPLPAERSSYLLAAAEPSASPSQSGTIVAQRRGPPEPPPDVQIEEYDPWEPYNEKMFKFNQNFDRYVLKPVAKGYNFVMPDLFQQMIGNGFDNINVVPKLANNLLQWNLKGFGVELGRFLINSTLGIGGLFDIAKQEFGLDKTFADFGQTLGRWGLKPGPYVIVPFMPPFTVRDGIGYGVDIAMDPLTYVLPFIWDRLGMRLGQIVNDRSLNLELFQGIEETTLDLYTAVRNGYLQRRENLIRGIK
jgi:phospholipid-binding lipoprotein MlaA